MNKCEQMPRNQERTVCKVAGGGLVWRVFPLEKEGEQTTNKARLLKSTNAKHEKEKEKNTDRESKNCPGVGYLKSRALYDVVSKTQKVRVS